MPIEGFTSWRDTGKWEKGQWYMTGWGEIQFPRKQTKSIRKWVYRIVHHLIEQAKPKVEVSFDGETIFRGKAF